ncbi:MAG: tripartite tricarboxylate transporter substrate binding protein, partial [Deltaproteobacteria bacterium]
DILGRAIAKVAPKYLGQSFAVVNFTGGSGTVGTAEVAKAKPDGYTILMAAIGPLVSQPHLNPVPYKVPDDFVAVAYLCEFPMVFTVKADAPCDDVKGFIEWGKKESKGLIFGQTSGSVLTLTLEEFRMKSGANMRYVAYNGTAPAITALLGGHIHAVPAQPAGIAGFIASKQVKVLAASSEKPIQIAGKTIPTFKEQGYNIVMTAWNGVLVPKGTPPEIIKKLEEVFRKISMENEEYQDAMKKLGQDIVFKTGSEYKAIIQRDYQRFGEIIRALGKK